MSEQYRVKGSLATLLWIALLITAGGHASAQEDSLFVDPTGNVGIGTTTPLVPLHILRTSETPSLKNMFRLTNNGGIQFLLERTDGNDWQFSNFNASFQISIPGGQEAQLQVIANGDVIAGRNMMADQFIPSSSRERKENVLAVDPDKVLQDLASVPISQWTFKGEDTWHIGPMAEDFQAVFGFGQLGTGLSLTDSNGVVLAAIQGLYAELQALERTVEGQRRLLDEQRQQIEKLQAIETGRALLEEVRRASTRE